MNSYILIIFCVVVVKIDGNVDVLSSPNSFIKFLESGLGACQNVNNTKDCCASLTEYVKGLKANKMWALKMFDSKSHIPSGIFFGSMGDLGVYDECLDVNHDTPIQGKYCLGSFRMWKLAFCFPSNCTALEMQRVYNNYELAVDLKEENCQTLGTRPELDELAIFTIALFGVIASIMIVSTAYDVFNYYTKKESKHVALTAFSVFSNGRKLLHVSNSPSQIHCLHGLRVISIMWIILGHRYKMHSEMLLSNSLEALDWIQDLSSSYIFGAWVAVETFLFMSGFVISYTFMAAKAKGVKFNVVMFYVHRYIRLTPPYAALILINASLMKHLGNGPQWPERTQKLLETPCRNWWWTALLYVQNYVNYDQPCMGQTWYLSVDTQLFLLSPLVLIPLYRWSKVKPFVLGILILVAALIPSTIGYVTETKFMPLEPAEFAEYVRLLYYPTHARAVPWLIGLSTGYIVYHFKKSGSRIPVIKTNRGLLFLFAWIVSLVIMLSCVIGTHFMVAEEYDRFLHSFFIGFASVGWSAGLCFVVLLCVSGYGGFVNWLLSNPFMQVLSRFTYSMYLVHKLVLSVKIYSTRRLLTFDNIEITFTFWSDVILTLFVAALWVLAFESPVVVLEKLIFGRDKSDAVKPTEGKKKKESA